MHDVEKEAVMPLFVTFVNVQGSHEYSCIEKPYKVLKRRRLVVLSRSGLRHIINYKVLKPQTSNLKLVITEPILLVIAVIYVHFYFIIKHLSQSII